MDIKPADTIGCLQIYFNLSLSFTYSHIKTVQAPQAHACWQNSQKLTEVNYKKKKKRRSDECVWCL